MFSNYIHNEDPKNAKVIQLYGWIAYDIFLTGLFVYNWMVLQVQTFTAVVDSAEKFMLFCCTVTFAGYRIYILHLDAEKKKIENEGARQDLKDRQRKSA